MRIGAFAFYSAATVALLACMAPCAVAADRELWVGRDIENSTIFWTCTATSGDNWTLKKNGAFFGTFKTVASTDAYIEIKGADNRIRLYSDKMMINAPGSDFKFFDWAKGKWQ